MFIGPENHRTRYWFSSNPSSRNLLLDYHQTPRSIPTAMQMSIAVGIDQTTQTISPSRAVPSPKSPVEVAVEVEVVAVVGWLY